MVALSTEANSPTGLVTKIEATADPSARGPG